MSHSQFQIFFIQLSLMLMTALIFGLLMKKMGQASVLGELVGGILLGPSVFGVIQPAFFGKIFHDDALISSGIDALMKVGMLFFMFAAGLEINFVHFRSDKFLVASTSILGGALPFLLGFGLVVFFPQLWQQDSQRIWLALFIGTALSISALPVIGRILLDLGLINSRIGMTIMSAAMLDDIVGWGLFTFILSKHGKPEFSGNIFNEIALLMAYAMLILSTGRLLILPCLRRFNLWQNWQGGILILISSLILLAAAGAETLGIHAIFGAFMVGIALGHSAELQSEAEQRVYALVELFALNFFAPLYFVSIGLKVNFLNQFDVVLAISLTIAACFSKILGAGLGARVGGLKWREAFTVGVGLNARGAVGIILASVALEQHLINHGIFVALVFMALVTTLISGFVLKFLSPQKADFGQR